MYPVIAVIFSLGTNEYGFETKKEEINLARGTILCTCRVPPQVLSVYTFLGTFSTFISESVVLPPLLMAPAALCVAPWPSSGMQGSISSFFHFTVTVHTVF